MSEREPRQGEQITVLGYCLLHDVKGGRKKKNVFHNESQQRVKTHRKARHARRAKAFGSLAREQSGELFCSLESFSTRKGTLHPLIALHDIIELSKGWKKFDYNDENMAREQTLPIVLIDRNGRSIGYFSGRIFHANDFATFCQLSTVSGRDKWKEEFACREKLISLRLKSKKRREKVAASKRHESRMWRIWCFLIPHMRLNYRFGDNFVANTCNFPSNLPSLRGTKM
jgi:hypothetical protein